MIILLNKLQEIQITESRRFGVIPIRCVDVKPAGVLSFIKSRNKYALFGDAIRKSLFINLAEDLYYLRNNIEITKRCADFSCDTCPGCEYLYTAIDVLKYRAVPVNEKIYMTECLIAIANDTAVFPEELSCIDLD